MSSLPRTTIAHHLILTGYGHWLPNDPRGSGSEHVRKESLRELGKIHHERKNVQPPRTELKTFYQSAESKLAHQTMWFDGAKRQAVADAFANVIQKQKYTSWGGAILRNHAHLCIRRHRDSGQDMWSRLAEAATAGLRLFADVTESHPIWSDRPYIVFLYTPDDVRRTIAYIERNIQKHQLPSQKWNFVVPYNNWPLHKRRI